MFKAYLHVTKLTSNVDDRNKVTQLLHNRSFGKKITQSFEYEFLPENVKTLLQKMGLNCSMQGLASEAEKLYKDTGKPIISYRLNEDGTFPDSRVNDPYFFFLPGIYEIKYTKDHIDVFT